jgi:protein phosphatase
MRTMSAWVGIGRSETGLVRVSNQDAFVAIDRLECWAVADGIGGHVGGDIAAQTAIASVKAQVESSAERFRNGEGTPAEILTDLVVQAHRAILGRAKPEPNLRGMGTTIVLLWIPSPANQTAYVAHVGDSRAYRFRSGTLTSLTRDHTLIEKYLAHGILTENSARTHPERHVLTQALGMSSPVKPSVASVELAHQDVLLLCSDGLTKMLEDDNIRTICADAQGDPIRTCDHLIAEALDRGGEDNVTVVVIAHP